MKWMATLGLSIVPRILSVFVAVLLLTVGVAAARAYDLNWPGSDMLAPTIARADNGDGDLDDDGEDEVPEGDLSDDEV